MRRISRRSSWISIGALTFAANASGAIVDVRVSDLSGNPIADAVVVFDPLDQKPPAQIGTTVIDQINQQFVPRVAVIRSGTSVAFPNSDRVRHQVYSFSPAKMFTLKLYAGSPKMSVEFDKPGLIVLGCNIHDSMVGFLAVVDTPYFGKSAARGTLQLSMPNGRYRLRAWHENEAKAFASHEISVAGDTSSMPIQLDMAAQPGIPAAWPD
jgi:plastocyanin